MSGLRPMATVELTSRFGSFGSRPGSADSFKSPLSFQQPTCAMCATAKRRSTPRYAWLRAWTLMSETAALTGLATGASLGRDHARVVVVLLATRRKGDENAAASTRLPIIARSYV